MKVNSKIIRISAMTLFACLAGCSPSLKNNVIVGQIEHPGNTQVPLPPGNWHRLAGDITTAGRTMGGGIDNSHSARAYYANVENGKISQLVFVATSEGSPAPYGYGNGADCLRVIPSDYVYLSDSRSGTPNAIDCLKVTGARSLSSPGPGSSQLYQDAYEAAKAHGGLPRFSVQVEFAEAHSQRYETYYMYFFPNQARAATRSVDWRVGNLTPERQSYVDSIVAWARDFRDAVRLGTEYRL